MNKQLNFGLFVVMLVVLFMAGGHLLDIGDVIGNSGNIVNGLITDYNLPLIYENVATNGFFDVNPTKVYHLGYYLMYVAFMLSIVLNLYLGFTKWNI